MRSLVGLPNTLWAGDCLVKGSGVFLYERIAFWKESLSRSPVLLVLPEISLLTVLTPTSARQLLWGL